MSEALALVVELCGKLADVQGREITVPIPAAGCTAASLLDRLREGFPALAPLLVPGKVRVCINEAIAPADGLARPGDLVALFPPVSGG
ncbi:MoaD/ThiS family protein [Novosphingobium flavum]|uniref:MoaD/ThiS family protein n=1 Tax=Novosphingobium aerophilum TaxID=2839843 RepID=A0A7X1F9Z4_9SPHN|nr:MULTISPECIES: MoaD/ThiS family protein [Novosphingobium]MBC2653140.1 MoaD/ThiS family protein [Novosphingobium aerophilum]MBC2661555.1 MoaD/ThiS family protein [Novosphingobium aerophilum]